MASRSPKLFCNSSVSSFQWALVSTLFSHTHFRAFLAVMADVIKQINTTIPALKTVSFRQDSTGCYHCRACRATIVCAGVLGAELGVVFKLLAPFPSLPFPSLPFPSLPFPSLPFPCFGKRVNVSFIFVAAE